MSYNRFYISGMVVAESNDRRMKSWWEYKLYKNVYHNMKLIFIKIKNMDYAIGSYTL